jgi:hypothetical protein
MSIMRHATVLQALTYHAQPFNLCMNMGSKDPQHSWALDETGTLETLCYLLCNGNEVEQKEISELNNADVPEKVLQVHGYAPATKAEGTESA